MRAKSTNSMFNPGKFCNVVGVIFNPEYAKDGDSQYRAIVVFDGDSHASNISVRFLEFVNELPFAIEEAIIYLREKGWSVADPNSIPLPRSLQEAKIMNMVSEQYIKAEQEKNKVSQT